MVSMLGAFAGAGVLQGLGEGMLHERNLQEAMDMQHKNLWDGINAQKELDAAKEQNKATEEIAVKNRNMQNDPVLKSENALKGVSQNLSSYMQNTPQQGYVGGTPGVPQGLDTSSVQPRTAPIGQPNPTAPVQGQGQIQQANLQPPTGAMGNQPQQQPMPNPTQAPPGPQGGLNSPQGGPVNLSPPPTEDIPPTAPASQIAGQADAVHTAATKDPYDIAAHVISAAPGGFNQPKHDMFMDSHAMYPNLSPEAIAAGVNDYAQGNWESRQKWNEHMAKIDSIAFKNINKEPITEDKLAPNEQSRYTALKNTGNLPDAPVQVNPLTTADKQIRSKNAIVAQRAEQGSSAALDSFLRQTNLQGKYDNGVGASTIADFSNTISSWLGAGETEKAAAAQQMGKESIDSMVSLMQSMPPGTRQGAQMAKYDLQGVADTTKGAVPNLNVINSMFGKALMNNQAAYLQTTAGRYETQEQIDQLTASYKENNPPFLEDGKTPNPKWQSAKDWIASGAKPSAVTQQGNLQTGRQTLTTKRIAAEAGQNPAEVGNTPNAEVPPEVIKNLPPGATNVKRIK